MKFHMKVMKVIAVSLVVLFVLGTCSYGMIGTSSRVDTIKEMVPDSMAERGWEIMRYEGYTLGSFDKHGGKVYYHVRNIDDHSIQYRVQVTLWDGELHFYYDEPEKLDRINVDVR